MRHQSLSSRICFGEGNPPSLLRVPPRLFTTKTPCIEESETRWPRLLIWIDQPIPHGIKERLSYSPQPKVARFHPYGKIKEMFEKHRQEAQQKAFIQYHRHTRKYDEGFEICDNGFNSLGSLNIFHGPRYRNGPQIMGIVQEVVCPKKRRLSRSSRPYT